VGLDLYRSLVRIAVVGGYRGSDGGTDRTAGNRTFLAADLGPDSGTEAAADCATDYRVTIDGVNGNC